MMIPARVITAAVLSVVTLRGGAVIDAPVEDVSVAGLRVGGPAPRTISWDRVRAVDGVFAEDAALFATLSDDLWRARTRLGRGDIPGAARALDRAESACTDQPGQTPLVFFTTALECRLRQGDQPRALRAFLQIRRQARDADAWARAGLDPATGLAPGLAPIMTPAHTAAALGELRSFHTDDPALARTVALYTAALSGDPGELPPPMPEAPQAAHDAPAPLLDPIARALAGDPDALATLRTRIDRTPETRVVAWADAWDRAAVGRVLLRSSVPATARLGAVYFLSVPAGDPAGSPYLSGLALAESAAALEAIGEYAAASTLRAELSRVSPDHPASP